MPYQPGEGLRKWMGLASQISEQRERADYRKAIGEHRAATFQESMKKRKAAKQAQLRQEYQFVEDIEEGDQLGLGQKREAALWKTAAERAAARLNRQPGARGSFLGIGRQYSAKTVPVEEITKEFHPLVEAYRQRGERPEFYSEERAAELERRRQVYFGEQGQQNGFQRFRQGLGGGVQAGRGVPAPSLTPRGGRKLDEATAMEYMRRAGGDKKLAREMALRDGWTF